MSLENLPEIEFCSTDAETIEQNAITVYEGIVDTTLYPGDPVRLFLEGLLSIIIQQRQVINFTGRQNLLKYSEKDFLKHLGVFTETPILEESKSRSLERFSMAGPLGYIVPIPIGTRVSPDGQLMFETLAYAEISIGSTYVDVDIECQTAGIIGNNLVPGQINKLVDPLDYIGSVSNVDISSGGAEVEADDSYRERIHTAPESFSVAGPSGAYEHWSKSAHQDIVDVRVYRTSPLDGLTEAQLESVLDLAGIAYTGLGRDEKQIKVADWLSSAVVNVCPLLTGGGIPDQTMLDLVDGKLNERTIRPLTDRVMVAAPSQVSYNIDLTYYISSENRLVIADIQTRVAKAVDDYTDWQKAKLGRDINPAQLTHVVVEAGAHRVAVTSPVYAAVGIAQVAKEGSVNLVYGGLEDE